MAVAKKITINDVALAAGVSVSTVSLVLSGKGVYLQRPVSGLTRRLSSWALCVIARHQRFAAGKAG